MQWSKSKAPNDLLEFYGSAKTLVDNFMEAFYSMHPLAKYCIIHGPSGTGKTLLTALIAKKHGLDVFYSDGSDIRDKKFMNETMKQLVTGSRKMVVLDEYESIGKNLSSIAVKYENFTVHPLIIICEDIYKVPSDLRKVCWEVEIKKPTKMNIQLFLESFVEKHNIKLENDIVNKIISNSYSYRGVVNNIQIYKETGILYEEFEQFEDISEKIRKTVNGMETNLTNEELTGWVASNATNQSVVEKITLLMGYNRLSGGLQYSIRNLFNYCNLPDGRLEYFFTKKDEPKKPKTVRMKGKKGKKTRQPVIVEQPPVVIAKSDNVMDWI